MDEDFIKNYSLLDRYNVSRETCFDFEKFISMIRSENEKLTLLVKKTQKIAIFVKDI